MIYLRIRRFLAFILTLSLLTTASAQDWFSNADKIPDLAKMAPADSALFVAADLSGFLTEERMLTLLGHAVKATGGDDVKRLERGLGLPVKEILGAYGTRAFVAVGHPSDGNPNFVLGLEVRDPELALNIFRKTVGMSSGRLGKELVIGKSLFHSRGKKAYGIHADYFVVTNDHEVLEKTLSEAKSLYRDPGFRSHMERVMVDKGLVVYGEIPQGLDKELENFSHILASLGVSHHQFLSQLYLLVKHDSSLAATLLSSGGKLRGEAAKFIPDEWGFMLSFHLGYLQRARLRLAQDRPDISKEIEGSFSEMEEAIGITVAELLDVCDGEVSISSNGLKLLPALFLGTGYGGRPSYKLTVNLSLSDSHRASLLVKGAWKRLGLKTQKHIDDVVTVSGVELAYIVLNEQNQLIMSYGPTAAETLRECLALHEVESLASRQVLRDQFPIERSILGAYLDFEPIIRELGAVANMELVESLLLENHGILEGVAQLTVENDGLKFMGTGGMPMLFGAGAGVFWFSSIPSSREVKVAE